MSDEKAEKSSDAAGGSSGGGGGGNKVVIILAILNTVISIGAAVVLFLAHQKEKKETHLADLQAKGGGEHGAEGGDHGGEAAPAGEHGAPAAHGEAGADGKGAKKSAKFGKIIALDQFTINLSSAGSSLPKFARVNVSLEIGNDDVEGEVTQKMAQVRNSIIDLFNSKKPSDLSSVEGRNYLKEEIRNAINGFLVTGKIKSVFFTNFAVSS